MASLSELPEGRPVLRSMGSRRFLVVRRGDTVHVCGNICPHRGAPLSEGLPAGTQIVCPCHQGRFDLDTGVAAAPPARDDLTIYSVEISEGEVLVGSPRRAAPWHVPGGRSKRRVLILGAGAAGTAAAEALRREGFEGRIILAGAEQALPYDRTVLSKGFLEHTGEEVEPIVRSDVNALAGAAKVENRRGTDSAGSAGLVLRPAEFYEQARIELCLGYKAIAVEPAGKTVEFENGEKLGGNFLLLATGGVPRRLGLPGENLSGVLTLRSREDAVNLRRAVFTAGRVVILGAGFLGLEVAGSLRRLGLEVVVVAPEPLPLAGVFGEQVGRWVREQHQALGVGFRLGMTARELLGDGKVRQVLLSDGTRLEAEMVIEAVGIEPATAYLESTGLLRAGAVPVDEHQRTGAADIYAAGDLAALTDATGAIRRFEHWSEAEAQGRRAARAMLGLELEAPGTPFFWTEIGELTVKSVGLLGPAASRRGARAAVRGRIEESSFLVAYYDSNGDSNGGPGRLLGACAVGRDRELIAVGELLRRGLSLPEEELRDESLDLVERLRSAAPPTRVLPTSVPLTSVPPANRGSGNDTNEHTRSTT